LANPVYLMNGIRLFLLVFTVFISLAGVAAAQPHIFSEADVVTGEDRTQIARCQSWGQGQPDRACLQAIPRWAETAAASTALQNAFGRQFGLYTLSEFHEFGWVDVGYAMNHQFHENPQGLVFLNGTQGVVPLPQGQGPTLRSIGTGDAGLILRQYPNAAVEWLIGTLTGYRLSMAEGENQTFFVTYPIVPQPGCPACDVVGSAIVGYIFDFGNPWFDSAYSFAAITRHPPLLDPQALNDGLSVSELQQVLHQIGAVPGPVDGVMGARTQSALQGFQYSRCLDPTGIIDNETLRHLSDPFLLSSICDEFQRNPRFETLESAGIATRLADGPDRLGFGSLLDWPECSTESGCRVQLASRYTAQPITVTDELARTAYSVSRISLGAGRPQAEFIHPTQIMARSGERALLLSYEPCPTGPSSCLQGLLLPRTDGLEGYILAEILASPERLSAALATTPSNATTSAALTPDAQPAAVVALPETLNDCMAISTPADRLDCFDRVAAAAFQSAPDSPATPVVQPVAEWGPGIVPEVDLGYAPCAGRNDTAACLAELGLSDEAISFSLHDEQSIRGETFATEFVETGTVDVAHALYNGASPITWPVLLNGPVGFQVVRWEDDLRASFPDPTSQTMLSAFPEATVRDVAITAHRLLPDGTQRFVLAGRIVDGCRACAVLGTSISFLDIGPATGDALANRAIGLRLGGPSPATPPSPDLLASDPATLQEQLNLRGYDAGAMDGQADQQSQQALMAFQTEYCLADTGTPNSVTADALITMDRFLAPCAPR